MLTLLHYPGPQSGAVPAVLLPLLGCPLQYCTPAGVMGAEGVQEHHSGIVDAVVILEE